MTFVTAGFPTVEESVDIILGLEVGGAGVQNVHYPSMCLDANLPFTDIIELGVVSLESPSRSMMSIDCVNIQTALHRPLRRWAYYPERKQCS